MKQCLICKTTNVKNPNKDWHKGPTCKRCYGRQKARENYKNNPEKIKLKNKVWSQSNKEIIREINKTWLQANSDKSKIYNDRAKQYKAEFYQKYKEKYKALHARYYQENKSKIVSLNLKRRNSNPLEKIRHNLSIYVNKSLLKLKTSKSKKTRQILGISLYEFKSYLESKFKPGMTWENYGEWHIDHICPLSQALNEEELYKLWNYINLQPLWASENIIKSNQLTLEGKDICLKLLGRGWI